MTKQNLRPCPFCGNFKNLTIYEHPPVWGVEDAETEYSVSCHNCISGQLDTWNNRPLEDALEAYIASLEAENRALRHSLELRECEEMEHKPDPLEGVPFVSLSNAEIDAMTPEHPLYKLVRGDRKCKDE